MRAALATTLLLAGCLEARPPDGALACASDTARVCPTGYRCAADGRCYQTDHTPRGDGEVAAEPAVIVADGVQAATLSLRLADDRGRPVAGERVRFVADEPTLRFVQTHAISDAAGAAGAEVRGTRAGSFAVRAVRDGGDGRLLGSGTITLAADASTLAAGTIIEVLDDPVVADGVASARIRVTVRDARLNPIVGVPVEVFASGRGNAVIASRPLLSDDAGVATVAIRSTHAATKTLSVRVADRWLGARPQLTFVPGPAIRLAFLRQPFREDLGVDKLTDVVVASIDAHGNVVARDDMVVLTLDAAGDAVAWIAPHAAPLAGGTVQLDDLQTSGHAAGVRLRASAPSSGLLEAVSEPFDLGAWAQQAGPSTARVVAVELTPVDEDRQVALADAKIYVTRNGGALWRDRSPATNFGALARAAGRFYAGASTLWQTDDHGDSWVERPDVNGAIVAIAASVDGRVVLVNAQQAYYRSVDAGVSFSALAFPAELAAAATQLLFDPVETDRVYLGGGPLRSSRDGGLSWKRAPFAEQVTALARDEAPLGGGGVLWIGTDHGVFETTDLETFHKVEIAPLGGFVRAVSLRQGRRYVATEREVYESDDGATWYVLGINFGTRYVTALAPRADGRLEIATEGKGIVQFDAAARSVPPQRTISRGLSTPRCTGVYLDGAVYVSTEIPPLAPRPLVGLWQRVGNWQSLSEPPQVPFRAFTVGADGVSCAVSPGYLGSGPGLWRLDGGAWRQDNSGLPLAALPTMTSCLGGVTHELAGGTLGAFRRPMTDVVWSLTSLTTPVDELVHPIASDGAPELAITCARTGGAVRRSDDDGATWSAAVAPPGGTVSALSLRGAGAVVLDVGTTQGDVWSSADGGATWAKLGALGSPVRVVRPAIADGRVYAGTDAGLWVDDGAGFVATDLVGPIHALQVPRVGAGVAIACNDSGVYVTRSGGR